MSEQEAPKVEEYRRDVEIGGRTWRIRKPNRLDLSWWREAFVVFDRHESIGATNVEKMTETERREDFQGILPAADRLILRCVLSPAVVPADTDPVPEGALPLDAVDHEDRIVLEHELLVWAGVTKEAADDIRPSSPTTTP